MSEEKPVLQSTKDLDLGLRHVPSMDSDEFIRRYCEVFRKHAYATVDDNLNEFEKLITAVLQVKIHYDNISQLLGMGGGISAYSVDELLQFEAGCDSNAIDDADHTDDFTSHRTAMRNYVFNVEEALAESEQYGMLEDEEIRSLAKVVVMYHLFKD